MWTIAKEHGQEAILVMLTAVKHPLPGHGFLAALGMTRAYQVPSPS